MLLPVAGGVPPQVAGSDQSPLLTLVAAAGIPPVAGVPGAAPRVPDGTGMANVASKKMTKAEPAMPPTPDGAANLMGSVRTSDEIFGEF
jgi:hypothetical protein